MPSFEVMTRLQFYHGVCKILLLWTSTFLLSIWWTFICYSSHTSDCYHERPGIRYTLCFIRLFYHCLAALLKSWSSQAISPTQAAPSTNTKTVTVLVLTLRISQGSGHAWLGDATIMQCIVYSMLMGPIYCIQYLVLCPRMWYIPCRLRL